MEALVAFVKAKTLSMFRDPTDMLSEITIAISSQFIRALVVSLLSPHSAPSQI